jgi:hypothetical protein
MVMTTAMTPPTTSTMRKVKSDTYGGGSLASGFGCELLTRGLAWI